MSFTPKTWINDPSSPVSPLPGTTPISAAAMIDLETRLANYVDSVAAILAFYGTVQDEGTPLAQQRVVNFTGAGVTATNDGPGGRTLITIPGGGTTAGPYAVIDASAAPYNVVGNNSGNQATGINAAIAAASTFISTYGGRGALVLLPMGVIRCTSVITLPAGVSLKGQGIDATQVYFPTDLDPSATHAVWAIDLVDTNNDPHNFVADLHLSGPGTTHTIGVRPANMHGLKLGSHGRAERVRAEHFDRGINGFADHGTLRDCVLTNNFDGFYLGPSPFQIGDWTFDEIDFTGNTRAGIGVSRGTSLEGSSFLSCHTGFSPYGILQDNLVETTPVDSGTPNKFLNANNFIDVAFESYGNAAIGTLDLTQAGSVQQNFFMCGAAGQFNATYQIAANDHSASVIANTFNRNRIFAGNGGVFGIAGTYACIKVQTIAVNNQIHDMDGGFLQSLTVPWAKSVTDGNVGDTAGNANAFYVDQDGKWIITPVSGTVAIKDLLEQVDYRVRRSTNRAIAGVCMSPPLVTGVDSVVFMAVSGPGILVQPQVFSGQTVGAPITQDPANSGKVTVIAATPGNSTAWDPPSVGAGAQTTTTITVPGAVLGNLVVVSFSLDLQGMQLTGYVSATNTVTVVLRNGTAGALDLASGTLRASVWSDVPVIGYYTGTSGGTDWIIQLYPRD